MENFPSARFDRRRFLKSGIDQIKQAGMSTTFSQNTWGNAAAGVPVQRSTRSARRINLPDINLG